MKTHRILALSAIALSALGLSTAANATVPPTVKAHENHVHANEPRMAAVHFNINSDRISDQEYETVYDLAGWLQQHPGNQVVITGYADKDTGSKEWNHALSERRATAVAEELEYVYGIDPSQLIVEFDGSDVQPFNVNADNRVVLVTMYPGYTLTADND